MVTKEEIYLYMTSRRGILQLFRLVRLLEKCFRNALDRQIGLLDDDSITTYVIGLRDMLKNDGGVMMTLVRVIDTEVSYLINGTGGMMLFDAIYGLTGEGQHDSEKKRWLLSIICRFEEVRTMVKRAYSNCSNIVVQGKFLDRMGNRLDVAAGKYCLNTRALPEREFIRSFCGDDGPKLRFEDSTSLDEIIDDIEDLKRYIGAI